ncbi:MAG: 50S ribosomal protein L4 [Candidatus Diapherotrites archaeon]
MKADVYSVEGKKVKEISLPKVFDTEYDSALIKRSVLASQSARLQPKGAYQNAGMDNSAVMKGRRSFPASGRSINVGHARLPRVKSHRALLAGHVARVAQARGGKRAHPPKIEQRIEEKINKKEKKKALASAIATTVNYALVSKRHKIAGIKLPIIMEDKFAELKKTADVKSVLEKLNLYTDVENAKNKKHVRAGKGKLRGRKYKRKKSLLIVTGKQAPVYRAARNLEGVEICTVRNLNAELLAPGAEAGRLTIWLESAISALETR